MFCLFFSLASFTSDYTDSVAAAGRCSLQFCFVFPPIEFHWSGENKPKGSRWGGGEEIREDININKKYGVTHQFFFLHPREERLLAFFLSFYIT